MSKPKIPNQKKKYQELNNRLNRYVALVEQIYNTLNLEAAKAVSRTDYSANSDKPFKWSDYPQTKKQIADIQAQFVDDIHTVIYRGTSEEWRNSNEVQDLMADKVLKAYNAKIDREKYKVLYQTNSDALKAFQNRKDKGFNVSAKLWQQSAIYKEELEAAISCAIQKGASAVTLSKQISKYLLDFPLLQKDYKEKYGSAEHLKDCEYRSIRLARSEINMAYRAAENERWQQMDFVVGYEIKLSGKHPAHDVCDILAGKYPKNFVWTGWHPNDLCYKIPILKTEEEFWQLDGRSETSTNSVNEVKDVPDSFTRWVADNQQRIDIAKKRGTLPYFLKDNIAYYIKPAPVVVQLPKLINKQREQPFKFDKSVLADLKKRGFSFGGLETTSGFNQSAISGFNLQHIDNTLSALFKEYGINISKREITVTSRGNAELVYKGIKDGDDFELKRFFAGTSKYKEVQHSLFVLPESLQGKGISKKVLSCFYDEYKKSGIAKINVHANINVGGYTWAKYGFSAEKRDLDNLFMDIKSTPYRNQTSVKLAENKVIDFYSKNDKNTLFPMNLIADEPYGKDVLLDSSWWGCIDMNNKSQTKVFETYLFR